MTRFHTVLLTSGLALALLSGMAHAQSNASASPVAAKPPLNLQMPALPEPVRVTLDPATTALLVLDYVEPICAREPKCKDEMLPKMTPFMARIRKTGMVVAYGTREPNKSKWLPEVAPASGDIQVVSTAQDRFYKTDLDEALKAKGIKTIIMVGWKVSGSITYSSVGATIRGYTVVVPMDTTAATTDYETTIGFYQILNQSNGNLKNEPLKPSAPTLSRTDLIEFK